MIYICVVVYCGLGIFEGILELVVEFFMSVWNNFKVMYVGLKEYVKILKEMLKDFDVYI